MLQAVAEGNRDAGWMADYARGRLRKKLPELQLALEGDFTDCQRWMLREELGHLQSIEAEIRRFQEEIGRRMQPYEDQIRHLVTIPGVDRVVAWTILAELGSDMTVFPDAHHAASWAGMCPGNRETAGKQMSGRTRKANPYLRRNLCQAAWAASHTKGTYLTALYLRLRVRCGCNRAIFAVAHQILIVAYQMLLKGEDYREMGGNYFDLQNKPKVVNRLVGRLTNLGYYVTLQAATPLLAPPNTSSVGTESPTGSALATTSPPANQPLAPPKRARGRPCKCASRGIDCKHKSVPRSSTSKPPDHSIPGT